MERIASRKNPLIRDLRQLGREKEARMRQGVFLCDGDKLLSEAIGNGARIREIVFREGHEQPAPEGVRAFVASEDAFSFASPLVNSPGPLFTVEIPRWEDTVPPTSAVVLENVQDPGNVGTVLRTAAALGCGAVILTGDCADPYNPKTVRGAMGALFRQRLLQIPLEELAGTLRRWELPLYGAALSPESEDVRTLSLRRTAVAVGNEGKGLSREILALCDKKIILPMTPGSESLNAAVAASILMWEMCLK